MTNRFAWCLILGLFALAVAGCGRQTDNDQTGQTSPPPEAAEHGAQAQDAREMRKLDIDDPAAVARHLEELAKSVPGVKDARCVVFGNTAVVGIDVDETLDRSRVGTLKYSVAEAFRKDPYGIDAYVTADMDLNARIREIRADIEAGHPVAGFVEELTDIIGRIMPQMPRDLELRDPPETEAPKTDGQL
jgi:YhcN/YlaJ family sporulation lipoprotein